jgi:hypothetical protein
VPAWTWEELEPRIAGCDALYVNFITGLEFGLEVAQQVRNVSTDRSTSISTR